jgi:hypothetical protein
MATAREFITLAMREAGVLGLGQTLNAEDINDGFTLLNRMLAQWQKRRWLVPNLYDVSAIGNGLKSNPIGPGQYYNAARPDKIQAAYFKQLSGGGGSSQVSYPLQPIWSYEDYSRIALKELQAWPSYYFYDAAFPSGNVYIWPVPTSAYEVHLICKGPIGFTIQLEEGQISNAGSGYVDGNYLAVPFTSVSSAGSGGTADVTVAGGIITAVEISDPGDGYKIGDVLTILNSNLGGTGSGFLWTVIRVTDSLDAEFNMPPEYEEAIHYNLCIRLTSMYQMPPNPVQGALASVALNTIKKANAQIPKLRMPPQLQFGGNYGFYIFNADQA